MKGGEKMATATKKIGRPVEPDARHERLTLMLREDEIEMIHRAGESESIPPAIFARAAVLRAAKAVLAD